jgi:hypothetical protein
VVGKGDRLQRVSVVAGPDNDGRTEIVEGLAGGERVVLDPPAGLQANQLVKVSE